MFSILISDFSVVSSRRGAGALKRKGKESGMAIAKAVKNNMEKASWIRRMFEYGLEMKEKYGEKNVFDLTLGNPMVEPPDSFKKRLIDIAASSDKGKHRYMPNIGYETTRKAVAESLDGDWSIGLDAKHVIMTIGAAGALNVAVKSLVDPGDEIMIMAPYFPEYRFYAKNHGAEERIIETKSDFHLNINEIKKNLNDKTKIIILNSPNNPTGVIYPKRTYEELAQCLHEHERKSGRTVYIISDEPYRKIVYGKNRAPSPMEVCRNTILCTSHSKDLGIPGERIGYAVVRPGCKEEEKLFNAMAFCNRTLGFVNAPALMQRVVEGLQNDSIDMVVYKKKRDRLLQALEKAGIQCSEPDGAFYLFPKSPEEDDRSFVKKLAEHRVLAVPGSGFGRSGYFRLSFCCDDHTIEGAAKVLENL